MPHNSIRRLPLLLMALSALTTLPSHGETMLLTGEVAALEAQSLTVPRAGRAWRYQIQWMAEEGSMVKAGDPVVIFDKGTITSQVDQNQAQLIQVKAARQAKLVELEQRRLQAEFDFKQRQLQQEKAKLDADVPPDFQSPKEYADKQFELMKADGELEKAQRALMEAKQAAVEEIAKLELDQEKAELELSNSQELMKNLELVAKYDGPIIYARHPWTGEKTEVGSTVQIGTPVASIPKFDELAIQAWANEVEIDAIKPGMSVTVFLDADTQVVLEGKVKQVAQKGIRKPGWGNSNWFQVGVTLGDSKQVELMPGMSVRVELEVKS
ncbi:HlyD family secretion protein [Ferrimonas aestuarii]|uniref:HlyD family efflux transporter periplasmic adaptor subunit n=1 Tax=Ferrimonas aestuarii TaxID=2569539 RepID=A0A4U1BR51_9GAMM|nr:HlyD family efflux transporter periplasmic adaptor subunit [Ferrimonas aestuarii]TKB57581.1 HlyD family efflux transporter periplasmic adaptor subunit [Ferrimonas aestuarii]